MPYHNTYSSRGRFVAMVQCGRLAACFSICKAMDALGNKLRHTALCVPVWCAARSIDRTHLPNFDALSTKFCGRPKCERQTETKCDFFPRPARIINSRRAHGSYFVAAAPFLKSQLISQQRVVQKFELSPSFTVTNLHSAVFVSSKETDFHCIRKSLPSFLQPCGSLIGLRFAYRSKTRLSQPCQRPAHPIAVFSATRLRLHRLRR